MSILNVNQIQPVGSGQTITISASDITASSATITASSVTATTVTSSSTSTFSSGLNVTGGSVGIGTDNSRQKLTFGSLTASSTSTPDCIDLGATYSGTNGSNLKLKLYTDGSEEFGFGASVNSRLDYVVPSNGNHVFYRGTTESCRINTSGNLAFPSGQGIDFSATANGSGTTTSELLDDYEEGTWTPQVTQGVSGTPTYTNQLGWYTKIGRIVTLYFYIRFGTTGNTGSNSIFQVGNFPFPVASSNNTVLMRGMGVSNYHSIPGFTSANISFYGAGNSNTFASVYQGQTSVATSSAVNSQYIIGGIEYISE